MLKKFFKTYEVALFDVLLKKKSIVKIWKLFYNNFRRQVSEKFIGNFGESYKLLKHFQVNFDDIIDFGKLLK